jgi:urate oxidase
MATVGENRYGKEGVRLVRVRRSPYNGNTFDEWIVRVLIEGDFVSSYTEGDNSKVLPTDTMKNTGKYRIISYLQEK